MLIGLTILPFGHAPGVRACVRVFVAYRCHCNDSADVEKVKIILLTKIGINCLATKSLEFKLNIRVCIQKFIGLQNEAIVIIQRNNS